MGGEAANYKYEYRIVVLIIQTTKANPESESQKSTAYKRHRSRNFQSYWSPYVHMYVYIHTYTSIHTHTCVYVCIYRYVCVYIYIPYSSYSTCAPCPCSNCEACMSTLHSRTPNSSLACRSKSTCGAMVVRTNSMCSWAPRIALDPKLNSKY